MRHPVVRLRGFLARQREIKNIREDLHMIAVCDSVGHVPQSEVLRAERLRERLAEIDPGYAAQRSESR